jgi:hypothetical protein
MFFDPWIISVFVSTVVAAAFCISCVHSDRSGVSPFDMSGEARISHVFGIMDDLLVRPILEALLISPC